VIFFSVVGFSLFTLVTFLPYLRKILVNFVWPVLRWLFLPKLRRVWIFGCPFLLLAIFQQWDGGLSRSSPLTVFFYVLAWLLHWVRLMDAWGLGKWREEWDEWQRDLRIGPILSSTLPTWLSSFVTGPLLGKPLEPSLNSKGEIQKIWGILWLGMGLLLGRHALTGATLPGFLDTLDILMVFGFVVWVLFRAVMLRREGVRFSLREQTPWKPPVQWVVFCRETGLDSRFQSELSFKVWVGLCLIPSQRVRSILGLLVTSVEFCMCVFLVHF